MSGPMSALSYLSAGSGAAAGGGGQHGQIELTDVRNPVALRGGGGGSGDSGSGGGMLDAQRVLAILDQQKADLQRMMRTTDELRRAWAAQGRAAKGV